MRSSVAAGVFAAAISTGSMPGLRHLAHERLGFERRHVGDQQAVGAGFRRVAHEAGAGRMTRLA